MNSSVKTEKNHAPIPPPPALALFQRADSLKWGLSELLSDSNAVSVQARAALTLVLAYDNLALDTIIVDSGAVYQVYFRQTLKLYAYPSRNAEFVLMNQPFSPLNPGNAWTQLVVKKNQSRLYSYVLK